MARKPAHLAAVKGAVFGRQAIWQVARKLRRFTRDDIILETGINHSTIDTYLKSLVAAGILTIDAVKPSRASRNGDIRTTNFYLLVLDSGADAPRVRRDGSPCTQGLPREQMWRTMRLIKSFNARDLAATASTDTIVVDPRDAADYVKHLFHAGYLRLVQASKPGTQAIYRLINDTGPRPPMVQRLKTVFDQNLGKIMWHEEVDA